MEGDRPQKAPVLESRETVYASNSRADPVQGTSYRELFVTKILSLLFVHPNAASSAAPPLAVPAPLVLLLVSLAVAVATLASRKDTHELSIDGRAPGGEGSSELLAGRQEEEQEIEEEKQSCRAPGKSATQQEKITMAAR